MARRMLDLYSGLGGASEAMIKSGWEVHRLEDNVLLQDVPGTTIQDVTTWPFRDIPAGYYDLIWASPPCVDFSDAYSSPKSIAARSGENFEPDMTLVLKAKEIIDYLQPQYWVIENVRGAQPFFVDLLGPAVQVIGSVYLWGRFPHLILPNDWEHEGKYVKDPWSSDPLRANKRAKIPFAISLALLEAIETQTTLDRWI